MIEKLLIKNYLIIKDAELSFSQGFNILTGETGAGKSIILDALSLILGERADFSLIRKDADKLVVEGFFEFPEVSPVINYLAAVLPNDCITGGTVIIRRELLKKGTSRSFINDYPVSISELKNFGDHIVDIHSQNEHQSLLRKETHSATLDMFAGADELLEKYGEAYARFRDSERQHTELISKRDEFIRKKSFIEFELKEINNLNPVLNEDEELENELKKLENIEVISEAVNRSLMLLYEDESNLLAGIDSVIKELGKISGYDNAFEKILEELSDCEVLIKENSSALLKYRDSLDFDSNRINHVRDRLGEIRRLTRKHGLTLEQLIARADELAKDLNIAENFDYESEKLIAKVSNEYKECVDLAGKLDKLRRRSAEQFQKKVRDVMNDTGLESAEILVGVNENLSKDGKAFYAGDSRKVYELGPAGYNDIEFLVKINKGTDFSPLRKSASGGEISRVMLAIKTVLAGKDDIGILVFDEIDAGISGRVSQKVGKIMKKLSESRQLICITHLPQIAAMSDSHFRVSKSEKNGETVAKIDKIDENEKITEVAKLISGENVTESANLSARELIYGV